MAASGFRSSWPSIARKSSLARLAASASTRSCSSARYCCAFARATAAMSANIFMCRRSRSVNRRPSSSATVMAPITRPRDSNGADIIARWFSACSRPRIGASRKIAASFSTSSLATGRPARRPSAVMPRLRQPQAHGPVLPEPRDTFEHERARRLIDAIDGGALTAQQLPHAGRDAGHETAGSSDCASAADTCASASAASCSLPSATSRRVPRTVWYPKRPGGQVAQLVEHRTENPGVGGSIPSLPTRFSAAPGTPDSILVPMVR